MLMTYILAIVDDDQKDKIVNAIRTHYGLETKYTMIDNHQDVFSRNFCGEGVPYFYLDKIGYDKQCDANILTKLLGLVKYPK